MNQENKERIIALLTARDYYMENKFKEDFDEWFLEEIEEIIKNT